MGRPWGEGQHGCCGSHTKDDSAFVKTWAHVFVSFPTTELIVLFYHSIAAFILIIQNPRGVWYGGLEHCACSRMSFC